MPSFKKRALSLYLRNQCERQFALYLYNDAERSQHTMPSRQQNRSGLRYVGQAGYEWQNEKVNELKAIFGSGQVHENPNQVQGRPGTLKLENTLPSVDGYQFIIEGEYEADTSVFRQALGIGNLNDLFGDLVKIGEARPDVIQILPSRLQSSAVLTDKQPDPYSLEVQPNGETKPIVGDDARLRLRVIDIKLTSEPGAHYFAEVVYYSITLAAWLIEKGFDNRFVVVAAPAVWPGRHDASNLARKRSDWNQLAHTPTGEELALALEEDIEIARFDIFAPRIRRLLKQELPALLATSWDQLPWHVDHRCKGCEFLGYPWSDEDEDDENHELRCWPTAEREKNLSRVCGLSRGASQQLRDNNVQNVDHLANELSTSTVFNQHQSLRTKRTAFPHRAIALQSGGVSIIPNSGGDALMPRWPNLHIYLFIDYDLSSAITATMGIRAFWMEPLPFGSQLQPQQNRWPQNLGDDEVFLVDQCDLGREQTEFLRFLRRLASIIDEVRRQDDSDATAGRRATGNIRPPDVRSTYQIYLWDESQRKQLVRMVGRHLSHILSDSSLHELVWLFPPPELLQDAEEATRQSAITLVKPVAENTVALDVPHYYRLLDIADKVTPSNLLPATHPLYKEPLSDLIPMERLHEVWNRAANWLDKQRYVVNATRAKVYGLSLTVNWLEVQLAGVLSRQAAPLIVRPPRTVPSLALVSRLWLGFTRLNAALDGLETHTTRAMPPHEREARLKSARLERRLGGQEKLTAIVSLNQSNGTNLIDRQTLFVYTMREDSNDVNLRKGDFQVALSPEAVHGFLDEKAFRLTQGTQFWHDSHFRQTVESAGLTSATIVAIDRVNRLIALELSPSNSNLIQLLEQQDDYDFSQNVVLDPTHKDYLVKKVQLTLQGIGNPPSAGSLAVTQSLRPGQSRANRTNESPASEILWNAQVVQQQSVSRNLAPLRQVIDTYFVQQGATLDSSQWQAWEESLTRKLALLWGPPGTGKSRTLRAVILGAAFDAFQNRQTLRLLVTANTYNAIDNILLDLEADLLSMLGQNNYRLYRVQSSYHESPPLDWIQKYPSLQNSVLHRSNPSQVILALRQQLDSPNGIVIVGCPPQQLHNLSVASQSNSPDRKQDTIKNWFDLIVLDEASQMDVATSTLVFSKRATNGAAILAGDDKQLPPIHQAEPPEGLESVVGSIYDYYRHHHGTAPQSLDTNYRSNSTITGFTKLAGYSNNLHSYSADLRLDFMEPIGDDRPQDWPEPLLWTPHWKEILDPMYPTVSFVYPFGKWA